MRDIPAGNDRPDASATTAVVPAFRRGGRAAKVFAHRTMPPFYLPLKFDSKDVVDEDER